VEAVSTRGHVSIRYERQELGGLNAARNRGATVAEGDVLAFLDDDTLVSPGWAKAMLSAFDRYPCAAVGGRVDLSLATPEPVWLGELRHYLAAYDLGPEPRWLGDDPVPVGANCAVRKRDFERLSGFKAGLDRMATSLVSNGDTEFFLRLRAAGGRLRYEPAANVTHCVPAERLTVSYFIDRHRAQGISDELLLRLQGHVPSLGHRVGLIAALLKTSKFLARDLLAGRGTIRTRFLVSYWSGRLSALGLSPPSG
jgi:GT2 family glycosyltransferase